MIGKSSADKMWDRSSMAFEFTGKRKNKFDKTNVAQDLKLLTNFVADVMIDIKLAEVSGGNRSAPLKSRVQCANSALVSA